MQDSSEICVKSSLDTGSSNLLEKNTSDCLVNGVSLLSNMIMFSMLRLRSGTSYGRANSSIFLSIIFLKGIFIGMSSIEVLS